MTPLKETEAERSQCHDEVKTDSNLHENRPENLLFYFLKGHKAKYVKTIWLSGGRLCTACSVLPLL